MENLQFPVAFREPETLILSRLGLVRKKVTYEDIQISIDTYMYIYLFFTTYTEGTHIHTHTHTQKKKHDVET